MKIEETTFQGIQINTVIYEESDFATAEQKQSWLTICNTCEFSKPENCGKCGCLYESLMNLATASCPIGKW